eukprot:TRINITY_DN4029_c1_g1_i1.p1 TRINITY_DN4029_c1_g1~~TRINITY_DN4029_c1_g1_i1.p1  ORF type:complete len:534 (-),score=127.16 TRINITY_DN4029_c1_g1_i1:1284-2885(-)
MKTTHIFRILPHVWFRPPAPSFFVRNASLNAKKHGFWKDLSNQREFMDQLAKKLNVQKWEDWYKVTYSDIVDNGGKVISRLYGHSHIKTITTVYPEHNWEYWKFNKVTGGYWLSLSNQRSFCDQVALELGHKTWEDWYQVPWVDIADRGGRQILKIYNDSRIQMMKAIYPEHPWDEKKFEMKQSTWTDVKNQRIFFDWLAQKLNVKEWQDWYQIRTAAVSENGGAGILALYDKSHAKALMAVYPEYQWKEWKFERAPRGTWTDKKKQREFFDSIEKKLGVKEWQDWYKIPRTDVVELGGSGILRHYEDSLWKALMSVYAEYPWEEEKFSQREEGFWKDKRVQRQFFEKTAVKLGVKNLDDWYSIRRSQIYPHGGTFINAYYGGSLLRALKAVYPEHQWREEKLEWRWGPKGSKSQNQLFSMVVDMLPSHTEVFMDMLLEDLLQRPIGARIELDVVVPSLSLAFEYQGFQHYGEHHALTGSTSDRMKADQMKRELCKAYNISLIEIPFWWAGNKEQLVATVLQQRPDVEKLLLR